jgi:predicted nuclease with TOPRIM domain
VGPISTGKTTAIRILKALLAGDVTAMPPEVQRAVSAVAGEVVFPDGPYSIVRPLVSTNTSRVDIAGRSEAERLPLSRTNISQSQSYKDWLLGKLGLPRIEVPSAPSRQESDPTPVTISDYLMYCVLSQREIDESVFGHADTFKNIKRKYVFEILYGLYNVAMAELQEQLRAVDAEIRQVNSQRTAFTRVLEGTPWENRASLQVQLDQARAELQSVEAEAGAQSATVRNSEPRLVAMASAARLLDEQASRIGEEVASERRSADRLRELAGQLKAQSARLTRSIVADALLAEIDFVVCPRCGTAINSARGDEETCCLCLQHPESSPLRETLIAEQDRIDAQITETLELVAAHEAKIRGLLGQLEEVSKSRESAGVELDFVSATFVSDSTERIRSLAGERARLAEQTKRLDDYLILYDRLDDLAQHVGEFEERRLSLQAQIEAEADKEGRFSERVELLEANLRWALGRIGLPDFVDASAAVIDRSTFLPVLNGRSFNQLSSPGLKLLVNVAHAIAHHKTALELNLPLPGLLVLDGISSQLGHEGFDRERLDALYALLLEFATENADKLQVIVADNDEMVGLESYVRLRLTETDRLIPQGDQLEEPSDSHDTPSGTYQ